MLFNYFAYVPLLLLHMVVSGVTKAPSLKNERSYRQGWKNPRCLIAECFEAVTCNLDYLSSPCEKAGSASTVHCVRGVGRRYMGEI